MEEKDKNERKDKETDKNTPKKSEREGIKSKANYSRIRLAAAGVVVLIAVLIVFLRVMNFNRPPLTPSLVFPQNGGEVSSDEIILKWQDSDPDGDKVYYDLYLSTGEGKFKKILSDSTTTNFEIKIKPGVEYRWKVVAKDKKGGITSGPVWTFHSRENNPPAVPVALSPQIGETVNSTYVTLSWDCHDIDGDSIEYKVFVDGKLVAITKENNLKITADYGDHTWKIIAIDSRGAKSEGGPWNFSVVKINHVPAVSILSPKGKVEGETAVLKWRGNDEDGDKLTYEVYLNGNLIERTTSESTKIKLKPGKYTLKVLVTDGKATSQDEVNFTVEPEKVTNMPPLPPFGPVPYNGAVVRERNITLSWASEDMDSTRLVYDLYINGMLVATDLTVPKYSGTFSYGRHKWQVVVKDDSGNVVKGPEWSFVVVKKQSAEKSETKKIFVAGGVEGVYIIEVPTLRVLYNFSLFPAYSISKYGKYVLIGNDKTLILMEMVGDYLKVQKTLDMPSRITDVFIWNGKEYCVGKDFVYVDGKMYMTKNNGSIAVSKDRIYLATGNVVKVYDKYMNLISNINTGSYVKRLKIYQDKLFAFTDESFVVIENGKIRRLSLPSPEDAIYSGGNFIVADSFLGVVKLNSNLNPVDIISLKGAKRVLLDGKDIIVLGKGIYVIRAGKVINKTGTGEDVEKVYGDYYATKDRIFREGKAVYEGNNIEAICAGKNGFAAIDDGFLVLNGKKTDFKGYDVGFYEGNYYVAGGNVTYILDENGKLLSKYGKASIRISRNGYALGYYKVWRFIDGKEQKLLSKAVDIDADITVSVLEQDGVEVFSWNLNPINRIDVKGQCIATKRDHVFVCTNDGIDIYKFRNSKRLNFISLPTPPKDLYINGNRLMIADGENGLVICDVSDPENPVIASDQYNIKVYDISW